jgi:hypothetical protein
MDDVVLAADVGPLRAGDVIARVSVLISPIGAGRSCALFFRTPEDREAYEVTHTVEREIGMGQVEPTE